MGTDDGQDEEVHAGDADEEHDDLGDLVHALEPHVLFARLSYRVLEESVDHD